MRDITGMDFSEVVKSVKQHKQTAVTMSEVAMSFLVLGSGLEIPFIKESEPVKLPDEQLCYFIHNPTIEDVRVLARMANELLIIGEPLYVSQPTE